jgi:hypothetical protein
VIDTQGHPIVISEAPGTGLSRRASAWLVAMFVGMAP